MPRRQLCILFVGDDLIDRVEDNERLLLVRLQVERRVRGRKQGVAVAFTVDNRGTFTAARGI